MNHFRFLETINHITYFFSVLLELSLYGGIPVVLDVIV